MWASGNLFVTVSVGRPRPNITDCCCVTAKIHESLGINRVKMYCCSPHVIQSRSQIIQLAFRIPFIVKLFIKCVYFFQPSRSTVRCNVSVQVDCGHGQLRCLEAHTWSSVLFLSHRNRCCCHVQHLHPKETRNSSDWRPFTSFQLSSKTQVQHQPLLQPTHRDPLLSQTLFPLARLALFLVRLGFCFAKTVLYLLMDLVFKRLFLSHFILKVHSQMSTSRLKDYTPTLQPWTGYKMTSSINRWDGYSKRLFLF